MLPKVRPVRLVKQDRPFDNPDWIYEIKHDGFRALAYVENGKCRLVSRNDNVFEQFGPLCDWIGTNLGVEDAILDGVLVVMQKRSYLAQKAGTT